MAVTKLSLNSASAMGVIKDASGCWIYGYSVNLGRTNNILAEIQGSYYGLKFVEDENYHNVLVEMDYALVVSGILKGVQIDRHFYAFIKNC